MGCATVVKHSFTRHYIRELIFAKSLTIDHFAYIVEDSIDPNQREGSNPPPISSHTCQKFIDSKIEELYWSSI